jgi:hypothetical protein
MRHQQYRESLLERLRKWHLSNLDGTITEARRELRKSLSESDCDLLFDNWLNANFDRIEVKEIRDGSLTAVIRSRSGFTPEQRADERRARASMANKMVTGVRSNLFEQFSATIWDTLLPNGVQLRDACGRDLKHATGWYSELAKRLKPTEKLKTKFSTRQLFDLSQRDTA